MLYNVCFDWNCCRLPCQAQIMSNANSHSLMQIQCPAVPQAGSRHHHGDHDGHLLTASHCCQPSQTIDVQPTQLSGTAATSNPQPQHDGSHRSQASRLLQHVAAAQLPSTAQHQYAAAAAAASASQPAAAGGALLAAHALAAADARCCCCRRSLLA